MNNENATQETPVEAVTDQAAVEQPNTDATECTEDAVSDASVVPSTGTVAGDADTVESKEEAGTAV